MRDPQRIVDEIQAFLMASDQTLGDRHPELAQEYREACEEVNKRLARCAQLLRQGLRAEALHTVEAEPNLLTALQTLDFSDRPAWLEVVGLYQLPSPPDLDHAVADHLSVAYADHDPHRNLLRKHRRLALARAPLRERLAVVRELGRVDITNPIWDEDRKAYEMSRFKQIHTEATDAALRHDVTAIDALEEELLHDSWATRPPNSLVQAIRKTAEALRQETARKQLPGVEARLNDAFSALDIVSGREQRARWITLTETAKLAPMHPLHERVEPALLWIEKEDEKRRRRAIYDQCVLRLEQALDASNSTAEQLERLHAALSRAEQDLADSPGHALLTQRYRTMIANLHLAAGRKRSLFIGFGIAAALAIGATTWLVYRAVEQGSARRTAGESLERALATGIPEEIDALLTQLGKTRPELTSSVEIQSRMPRVEALRLAESTRKAGLAESMREAEEAPPTGRTPPAVEAAGKLARTEEEKRAVETLARRIDRRDRELATEIDRQLLPDIDTLNQEINTIELDAATASRYSPQLIVRLVAISKRLQSALPDSGPLSEIAQARSEAIRQRITTVSSEIEKIGRQINSAQRLTDALKQLPDDPRAYIAAVTERASLFEGQPRATELRQVISDEERAIWEPALIWSRQSRTWANETAALDPESCRRRVEFCQEFLKQYPRTPIAPSVAAYAEYLEPISRRSGVGGSLFELLTKLLSNPSIDPLYMIRYKALPHDVNWTQRHYCASRVPEDGTISGTEFRISSDGRTRRKTLTATMIIGPRELSPQTKWARKVKDAMTTGELLTHWESGFIGWAKVAADDPEMDSICKLILMRALIEVGMQGSLAFREVMAPTLNALKRVEPLTKLEWLDPEADLGRERRDADQAIRQLPKKLSQN